MTYELMARFDRCKSFYGKAYVTETAESYILISYSTEILKVNKADGKITFLCHSDWAYSQTTNRHINEFLQQFTNVGKLSKREILNRVHESIKN